jgi:hypothetical protein
MIRFVTRSYVLGVILCAAATPSLAQVRSQIQPVNRVTSEAHGELHGTIQDDRGRPLRGAIVSALGTSAVFSVTDRDGRFSFRSLPAGPYLVRVHLQGYVPARGRMIQVRAGNRAGYSFTLMATTADAAAPTILAAGVGSPEAGEAKATESTDEEHAHGEVAWRLRHQKRSVLKEAEQAIADLGRDDSPFADPFSDLGRAVESSARLASALFADLRLDGHVNLLTTTSFDRPQDLFSMTGEGPRGVAYVSLVVPGRNGDWLVRGTMTQGDIASWIASGSYRRSADATHAYEAGLSYSVQRYLGGNGEALLAIRDGSRNVGSVYAYDDWAVAPRVRIGYGARYARYDYLPDESLLSPRASVTVKPSARDSLVFRAAVSHRETAPGAEEFTPPSIGLWLPPERTFSQISRASFTPERLDHVEFGAEREWGNGVVLGVRAFRQRVDEQVVTLFGLAVADTQNSVGHYHVGSAGDFEARGFTVSASRAVGDGVRAAVDYTQFDSQWQGRSADTAALGQLARSVLRKDERIHDLTASVETIITPSATRLFIMYKLNTGFATANDTTPSALHDVRFNVQVNQSLPFLSFMNANWEMLVAVTNLFRDDMLDSSVYDELFVVAPPKRVLGGVTVRF